MRLPPDMREKELDVIKGLVETGIRVQEKIEEGDNIVNFYTVKKGEAVGFYGVSTDDTYIKVGHDAVDPAAPHSLILGTEDASGVDARTFAGIAWNSYDSEGYKGDAGANDRGEIVALISNTIMDIPIEFWFNSSTDPAIAGPGNHITSTEGKIGYDVVVLSMPTAPYVKYAELNTGYGAGVRYDSTGSITAGEYNMDHSVIGHIIDKYEDKTGKLIIRVRIKGE